MQTILGAGGDIGTLLAKELKNYTNSIRLVARNPQKVNEEDELIKADITDRDAVFNAVQGSHVVYLVVGFKYNIKVWKKNWPTVMSHVIEACLHHQSKLVFFDNVYAYSKDCIPHMTEDCTVNPPSAKGAVRAQILNMLLDAINKRGLKALVARCADFYGPVLRMEC